MGLTGPNLLRKRKPDGRMNMRQWVMIVWIGGWLAACGSADIVNRETFVFKGATGSTAIQSLNGEVWMLALAMAFLFGGGPSAKYRDGAELV